MRKAIITSPVAVAHWNELSKRFNTDVENVWWSPGVGVIVPLVRDELESDFVDWAKEYGWVYTIREIDSGEPCEDADAYAERRLERVDKSLD